MIIGMIIIIITMIIIVIIIIIISISIKPKSINLKPTSILLKRAHLHQAQNQQQEHLSLRPSFPSLLFFLYLSTWAQASSPNWAQYLNSNPSPNFIFSTALPTAWKSTSPPLRCGSNGERSCDGGTCFSFNKFASSSSLERVPGHPP